MQSTYFYYPSWYVVVFFMYAFFYITPSYIEKIKLSITNTEI